eukprot:384713-Pyramimonas_sp.AAC.1
MPPPRQSLSRSSPSSIDGVVGSLSMPPLRRGLRRYRRQGRLGSFAVEAVVDAVVAGAVEAARSSSRAPSRPLSSRP